MAQPATNFVGIEVEHAIGFNGLVPDSIALLDNNNFVVVSGASAIICDLNDPHKQSFLAGHSDLLSCMAVSPKGTLLATGQLGPAGDVVVWDIASKKQLFRLAEHNDTVACMAFSDDSRFLATVGGPSDGKIFVFDMQTGNMVASCNNRPTDCMLLKWAGRVKNVKRRNTDKYQFATTGRDHVYLWALCVTTGVLSYRKCDTGAHLRQYTSLGFSEDRDHLFAGSESGDISIFHVFSQRLIRAQPVTKGGVRSLLVWGGYDEPVRMISGSTRGEVLLLEQDMEDPESMVLLDRTKAELSGAVSSLSLSPDRQEILAGTLSGNVFRVRASNLQHVHLSSNHCAPVSAVSFHPEESTEFATASLDGVVRLWDASNYSVIAQGDVGKSVGSTSLIVLDDIMITGWEDGRIRAFSKIGHEFFWQVPDAHKAPVRCMGLPPNQKFFVSGSDDGVVRVWSLKNRKLLSHIKEHTAAVNGVEIFDNSLHCVSCSRDRSFFCWDLMSGKRVSTHRQPMGGINAVGLLDEGTSVVTAGQERTITFWDLRQTQPTSRIDSLSGEVICLDVAPKPSTNSFATGGCDHAVALWDRRNTDKPIANMAGHSKTVNDVKFSPDLKQLVSAGTDGAVFVWNVFSS